MNNIEKINEILENIFEKEKQSKELAENYAREMLYGLNSIDLDSQKFFEQTLINFTRKKEILIPKIYKEEKKKYLYFNINKDWKSIWNIIFLGEIIKEQIISNLDIEVDIDEISEKEVIIENLPDGIKNKNIKKLKQSIRLIQKLKDSINHKENFNTCEEISENGNRYIKIENLGGSIPFKGKILLTYLEGFINNKIIPLVEDKEIADNTDKVAYPLLEQLGYDPKKIQNFFYRTNPTLLNYILEKLDNEYHDLYKLPIEIYSMDINDLKKLLNHVKVKNIKSLIGIPGIAFEEIQTTLELLKIVNKVEDLVGLPEHVFWDLNSTFELLKHPKVKSLNSLKGLPFEIILNKDQMFKLLNHSKVDKVESLKHFPKDAFSLSQPLLKLLDYSKIKNIDDLKGLPKGAFWNIKLTKKIIKNEKKKNELYKMSDIEFVYPKQIKRLLKHPKVKNIKSIDALPRRILGQPGLILKLLDHPKVENIESLAKLNDLYFDGIDTLIKLLNSPKVNKIEDLNEIHGAVIFNESEDNKYSINYLFDIIENVKSLNGIKIGAFLHKDITLKLLKHPKVKSIESLSGLSNIAFEYYESTFELLDHPKVKKIEDLRELSDSAFLYLDVTLRLLNNSKIDNINQLVGLPWEFFAHFYELEKIYNKYENFTIDIFKNIPIRLYEKIKIGKTEMFERITSKSYENIELNNLDKLLNRVDNNVERLFEFPDEFFMCDTKLLDNMLSVYNVNISKSIFGNYSPKTIYLICYMHTILTSYNFTKLNESDSKKYASIELECFKNAKYIDLDKQDNFQVQLNSQININQKKYAAIQKYISNAQNVKKIESLEKTNKKILELINDLKQDLAIQKGRSIVSVLGHLRNACSHFYFEESEDLDSIRVYDINEEGKKSFDAVFNMEDLFNLIKEVKNIDSVEKIDVDVLINQLNILEIKELEERYKILNENLKKSLNLRFLEDIKIYVEQLKHKDKLKQK